MFTVSFYINSSDKRHISKDIKLLTTKNCVLKDNTSIYSPTLIVEFDNVLFEANYIYIAETKRYYYINNITLSQQNAIIECSECDVLMSFKDEILNIDATIERQSNVFNTYLNDSEYLTYAYSNIITKEFNDSFRENEQFILIINGGD